MNNAKLFIFWLVFSLYSRYKNRSKYNDNMSENFHQCANKSFKRILPQWTVRSLLRTASADGILGYNFREARPELFAWYTSKPWPSSACRYRITTTQRNRGKKTEERHKIEYKDREGSRPDRKLYSLLMALTGKRRESNNRVLLLSFYLNRKAK